MKVIVLGSGVIGVTSAYYLARAGHQVTVIDRQPASAMETSFANAGQLSTGYSSPWAAPGVPLKAVKWLFQKHAPLVINDIGRPAMWRWLLAMLGNCSASRYEVNKSRMMRLSTYSKASLSQLREELDLRFEGRQQGTLQLFRNHKQMKAIEGDLRVLDRYGIRYEKLDRQGCIDAEPALARRADRFIGGLRMVDDETGDCFLFSQSLWKQAEALGVRFMFGQKVEGIASSSGRFQSIKTCNGILEADACVVALGSYSPALLQPLGIRLPVYPVKGYSLTVPITDTDAAPVSTVMDETYKVAITRFDQRIRVGGMAELAGHNLALTPARRQTLEMVVKDLFPEGGNVEQARFWTGLRPMTPDGTPVIGETPVEGLFTNCGHGTLGWTMACGSGRLLADLVSGHSPDIEASDLALSRYSGRMVGDRERHAPVATRLQRT